MQLLIGYYSTIDLVEYPTINRLVIDYQYIIWIDHKSIINPLLIEY